MLMLCLTYFHVMPEFLAFLYPFGFQKYPQADFNFSGFRQRLFPASQTQRPSNNRKVPIGIFQICYNFRSVEPSDSHEWSIRHCAVYHSFNLNEVRARWIIVKGDELMRRRIEAATGDRSLQGASDFTSIDRAFKASLETHMFFCDWSAEYWRWYINYLEDGFQNMTRMALAAPVEKLPLASPDTDQFSFGPRINTMDTQKTKFSALSWRQPQASEMSNLDPVRSHQSTIARTYTNPETGISQPLPPDEDDEDEEEEGDASVQANGMKAAGETPKFSFGRLRKIHRIAEKANEAVLVLGQNQSILTQLKNYYRSILNRKEFPAGQSENCKDAVEDFELRIEGLEHDLQRQILRLESLLRLLGERKTLVNSVLYNSFRKLTQNQLHSILDYQNTQANKYSTKSMVTMTEDMDDIARKTKIETVSMKVITLVTLFFLPGTFISVGRIFLSVNPDLVNHHRGYSFPGFIGCS